MCVCVLHSQLFQRLDSTQSGSVLVSQIRRYFRGSAHPDVTAPVERRRSPDEVEASLIELLQVKRTAVHRGQTAQMISWAVSVEGRGREGNGGEGREEGGQGKGGKWRGGEREGGEGKGRKWRGGEGRERAGEGREMEGRGGEGRRGKRGATESSTMSCLFLQEFEDYFDGQSIEFPSEEHFTAVVKACWTI